jgi:predicted regulator of Ras-like GTPase activity (Roadblock/LC7/MglB family)
MEKILKDINAMQGVLGSFICDNKGKILAAAMPSSIDESMLANVGRIITQTLGGLATTHRRKISDSDLVFGQGRFITKKLGESYLCILCVRNINVPLFDLTVNVAAKKLTEMSSDLKRIEVQESGKREAFDSHSNLLISEARSIISTARKQEVILKATGDTAIMLHCLSAASPVGQLEHEVLHLIGREKQAAQINRILVDMGYSPERAFKVLRGSQRLRFTHPQKQLGLEVFLDVIKMHHQLDFSESLNLYDDTIPLADLLLWELQNAPFDEQTMKAVYAIVSDHDLGGPGEKEKIDTTRVLGTCTGDWGWYKTVTVNLEKSINWAEKGLGETAAVFLERARRLLQMIKEAPKSGGWQLRGLFDEEPTI